MPDDILEKLTDFGLTKNESEVYLYLLQTGKDKGISKIALATKNNRQAVYRALEKLESLGLVYQKPYGEWSRYSAISETELLKIQKKRLENTEGLVKELSKFSKVGFEQEFEIVVGEEAFRKFEISRAKNFKEGEIQYIIPATLDNYMLYMGDSYEKEGLPILRQKKVQYKFLGNLPVNHDILIDNLKSNYQFKMMPNFNSGVLTMLSTDEYFCLYLHVYPPTIYVVKSAKVANSFKEYFMSLWNTL